MLILINRAVYNSGKKDSDFGFHCTGFTGGRRNGHRKLKFALHPV
jgi:hypothetical protein